MLGEKAISGGGGDQWVEQRGEKVWSVWRRGKKIRRNDKKIREDQELGEWVCEILECISYYWLYACTIDLCPPIHAVHDAHWLPKSMVERAYI